MCGFSGFICHNAVSSPKVEGKKEQMLRSIASRGPDFQSFQTIVKEQFVAALAHARLAIIDPRSQANQPMKIGNYQIVFNGIVYNFKFLRKLLQQKGVEFHTESDTEVILQSYKFWGKEVVHKLDGLFAFAIVNEVSGELFLARDRFGLRPLYYSKKGNQFAFGSTIKAVHAAMPQKYTVNWLGLRQNFQFQASIFPNTCFSEIKILPPGNWLRFLKNGDLVIQEYYSLPKSKAKANYTGDVVGEYNELLHEAVRKNQLADLPISLLLSGGIDSSVLAIIAKQQNIDLAAFTLGNSTEPQSDAYYAAQLANSNSISHFTSEVNSDTIIDHFNDLISIFEEPVSFIEPHYFIGKLMQESNYSIAWSGLGPDELLLGYHKQQQIRKFYKHKLLRPVAPYFPTTISMLTKLKGVVGANSMQDAFVNLQSHLQGVRFSSLFEEHINLNRFPIQENRSNDQQLSELELMLKISSHHALSSDKYLMHFGIEGRYPYLDKDVVEFQYHAPEQWKWFGKGKQLQRDLANLYFPKDWINRPKAGFSIPIQLFIKQAKFQLIMHEELRLVQAMDMVSTKEVKKILKTGINERNWRLALYLVSFYRWHKKWF